MKKPKIIIGNWKMNPATKDEAGKIFSAIAAGVMKSKKVQVVICPSTLHLSTISHIAMLKKSVVALGAQNFFHEEKGSYTGEISISMIVDCGVKYSIIGHSERRKLGETDEIINKKVILALNNKIVPILCIGETTRDEEGKYYSVIKDQLEKALSGITKAQLSKIIIAYEPVWAIGATQAMDAHDVYGMTIFIKKTIIDIYKTKGPVNIPILYGGAVDPENAYSIITAGEADGLLIGRQSLVPESFLEIIHRAQSL